MYQIIFKGPPTDKQIVLIKVGEHYHGCSSLKVFLGKNIFCLECETGYEHDTVDEHPCNGKKCRECCQTQCPDYLQHGKEPAKHTCPRCHRKFFGETCMGNHYAYSETNGIRANYDKKIKNVCSTVRKCKECNRLLRDYEIVNKRHVCGTSECPFSRLYKDLTTHKCFIQDPSRLEERRKLLRSRKRKAHGTQVSIEKGPLFVYWDSETMQDTGAPVPNLVCAATSDTDTVYHFEGSNCITDFLDWLRELNKEYKLTVLAHNSQGFDSYLILNELYKQYNIPEQIVNGAKILSLSIHNGEIVFKDSLCFF